MFKKLAAPASLAACLTLLAATLAAAQPGAGTEAYRVLVAPAPGADGAGAFAALTGPAHPDAPAAELLFFGDAPGDQHTSFLALRSYTTGTDYVVRPTAESSPNLVRTLSQFAEVTPLALSGVEGSAGYRTVYTLDASVPDSLQVTQDLAASADAITLTLAVANQGDLPVALGVRYTLDVALAGDDGPVLALPTGPQTAEASLDAPQPAVTVVGGTGSGGTGSGGTGSGGTGSGGTGSGGTGSTPLALRVAADPGGSDFQSDFGPPDRLTFAFWSEAARTAFEFTPAGRDITSTGGLDDAALLYYWGASEAGAITLAPGDSAALSLRLEAFLPGPETCDNGLDDDADGLTDGADPDCPAPTPTPAPTPAATPVPSPEPARTPAALPRTGGR